MINGLLFLAIVVIMGQMAFYLGESLPRKYFNAHAFPYLPFRWENGGMIYRKLKVHLWKDRVPDMSKHMRGMFRKKIGPLRDEEHLSGLVVEMCVAEFVHFMLVLASPVYLLFIDGAGGVIAMIVNALGNLPFILIQRYNRPRIMALSERQEQRKRWLAQRHGE